jgi:hypothetical protein
MSMPAVYSDMLKKIDKYVKKGLIDKRQAELSKKGNVIDTNNLTEVSSEFLNSLDTLKHPFSNFKDFFISLTQSVISFNASEISGKFKSNQDSKFILDKINKINSEIQELKAQIKKETNFNNKVKLNIELKNKKDNLLDFKEKL